MPFTLNLSLAAPLATVAAAMLAAFVALLSLVLTKENKTSEFRQAWINDLRDDLATFFASARAFTRAQEEDTAAVPDSLKFQAGKINEVRYQVAEAYFRIKLRLNANEDSHKMMMKSLDACNSAVNRLAQGHASQDVFKAVDEAVDLAQPLLKFEWNRVKKGEPQFVWARNALNCVLAIGLIVIVGMAIGSLSTRAPVKIETEKPLSGPASNQLKLK